MTTLVLTIALILGLAGLTLAVNRWRRLKICPICAGVSLTWILLLVARELGGEIDPVVLALLLGASAAGSAYWLEKKLPPGRSAVWWKVFFIPSGLGTAYGLIYQHWPLFAAALIVETILIWAFFRSSSSLGNQTVRELEKRMKNCC